MSPTERSLAYCRERGWTVQIVAHWNPFAKRRIDLFHCIDIISCDPNTAIIGIQATSRPNHAARIKKAIKTPELKTWILSGGAFEVWSWAKQKGKWKLRSSRAYAELWPGDKIKFFDLERNGPMLHAVVEK